MKKEFNRTDGLLSLCGLNCGLCPMQIRGDCSGCFNGSTCYQTCPLAPCSVRHGGVQYCFECPDYPCEEYDGIDRYDSLISHRNQKADMMKAKQMGIDAYLTEQRGKREILNRLLSEYDDGTRDVFYCLAHDPERDACFTQPAMSRTGTDLTGMKSTSPAPMITAGSQAT